jgi:hypothetical protein
MSDRVSDFRPIQLFENKPFFTPIGQSDISDASDEMFFMAENRDWRRRCPAILSTTNIGA